MFPWGTPFPVRRVWNNFHQLWLGTLCQRGSRLWKVGVRPVSCKSFKMPNFQVVSYAFSRSKKIAVACCFWIKASGTKDSKRTTWSVVLRPLWKPLCVRVIILFLSRYQKSLLLTIRSITLQGRNHVFTLGVQFLGLGHCTEQNTDGIPSFVHCYVKTWGGPSNFFLGVSGPPDPQWLGPCNLANTAGESNGTIVCRVRCVFSWFWYWDHIWLTPTGRKVTCYPYVIKDTEECIENFRRKMFQHLIMNNYHPGQPQNR